MAATPTNDDRGTSHAISHCICLPAAGEGGRKHRQRERENSLEGGVKVLDNCSTKCACWALWLQSGEVTRTYLCCKRMHLTAVSLPGIFIIAHLSIIWGEKKYYAFITSLHPYGATNELQQFAPWEWRTLVRELCTGLSEFSSNVVWGMMGLLSFAK